MNPLILPIHYAFSDSDNYYLVNGYVSGGSLRTNLEYKKKFSEDEIRIIAAEVGSLIGFLHLRGYIYHNLNATEILLDKEGHCHFLDFRWTKTFSGPVPPRIDDLILERGEYLAPEVLTVGNYNKDIDWWAFGILLFELVTGRVPFSAQVFIPIINFIDFLGSRRINNESTIWRFNFSCRRVIKF